MTPYQTITQILGCPVTAAHFTQWGQLLVRDIAPFFLSQDIDLTDEVLLLRRKAFSEYGLDLAYVDSYTTYAVSKEAHSVAMLTAETFDNLPVSTQQTLLAEQCRLGRGQVYRWTQVAPFLHTCLEQAETRCVDFSGERYFVLDKKIWTLLTPEQQQHWLFMFITADNPPACLSTVYASRVSRPVIQRLAGTFAPTSGANCFSTTLAAITQDEPTARIIADFWLHQEPFFHGLARRGYTDQTDSSIPVADLQDSVLIWQDGNGVAQHACYLIGEGLVFNKNSQAWFTPRQLLHLQTMLDDWQGESLKIVVYRRTG